MKKTKNFAFVIVLSVFISALCFAAVYQNEECDRQLCDASGIYDMLNEDIVKLYEKEIAGESIVSGASSSQLDRNAKRFNVDVQKLKAIMLLQDLAAKSGRNVSLAELAAMNDLKLISYFKQCAKDYLLTLPQERQEELERMFKSAAKLK